ncbi:MAG: polyprenyl synthetase family protein [Anaerolineae bacterium]
MIELAAFDLIRGELALVEDLILSRLEETFPALADPLRALFKSGGKRLRPAVTLLASKFHPCSPREVHFLAAATEVLHTATLVHDDLIDGALMRRGMPTLNATWARGATVLAGDYLFAHSADLAAQSNNLRVVRLFSQTLMTICDGELRQMFSSLRWQQPKEDYYRRIFAKTASLFEAAAQGGAILSGAPEEHIEALRRYGYAFGMAFQIVDDILDFIGDEKVMGKPAGSDLRQGTVTLPVFYFLQEDPRAPVLIEILDSAQADGKGRLSEAIAMIQDSPAIDLAKREAEAFVEEAKEALSALPDVPARAALADLADFVVRRHW